MLRKIYLSLPSSLQPLARCVYEEYTKSSDSEYTTIDTDAQINKKIYHGEYQSLIKEHDQRLEEHYTELCDKYDQQTPESVHSGRIPREPAKHLYYIVRHFQPETIIETGVANGFSTYFLLLAMQDNAKGQLYSIDLPFYQSDDVEQFREQTFDNFGGSAGGWAIPDSKNPGWLVKDELQERWELKIGKSQRLLPGLIHDLEEIDMFIHDSEHSYPCMMFEYELGWEYLSESGILLSHDTDWNEAWSIFNKKRVDTTGLLSSGLGYAIK